MDRPQISPTDRGARRLTAIFAKLPCPGRVKTRLCPPLSAEEAAAFAEATLADAVERCLSSRAFRTRLLFYPPGEEAWFRRRFPALEDRRPQVGEGLAARLAAFFAETLAEPEIGSAVAIGSDAPLIPALRIEEAHERLESGADLVLGPDLGGGYYLIAMRSPQPELFTAIRMSTGSMFDETLQLARSMRLSVGLLEPGYDVDVEADLERLREDLSRMDAGALEYPRNTARIIAELFAR